MVSRGAVVVISGASGIGSKPRPALIVQNDLWSGTHTIMVAPFTTDIPGDMMMRPIFQPSAENGLRVASALMVDKITPAKRSDIGVIAGVLTERDMDTVDASLRLIFNLA
jgi:mRNA interferase MazF